MHDIQTSDDRMAALAHEMRTPIQSIDLICELIQRDPDLPVSAIRKEIESMQKGCQTLLNLLDEAASSRRLPAGSHHRHVRQTTSLRDLGAYLCEQLRPMVRQEQRQLELNLDSSLPATIQTHSLWLEQILRNLLTNALRHGDGTIRLDFEHDPTGLLISVSDEGPGIPKEMQKEIFKPRVQLHNPSSGEHSRGSGLGLSMASIWARRLGGTLRVESGAGTGSTFQLKLPVSSDSTSVRPFGRIDTGMIVPHEENRSRPSRRPIPGIASTILIVDDNELQTDALREYLSAPDTRILTAPLAREAVRLLNRYTVDAIILDLNLPDGRGSDLIRLIRSHSNSPATPVILYSGETLDPEIEAEIAPMVERIRKKKIGSHQTILQDLKELLSLRESQTRPTLAD